MTRGAKPKVEPSIQLCVMLPETLRARLDLLLFSELEGRVPKGKHQEFFVARLREFFEWGRLDLAPYGFPPGYFISGPKEMLDAVEASLRARRPDGNPLLP